VRFGAYQLLLHIAASVYATSVRYASEAGRIYGRAQRHGLVGAILRTGTRFDWFAGLIPELVRQEQTWAARRCACHVIAVSCVVGFVWPWAG
jgi:hypothetical protein